MLSRLAAPAVPPALESTPRVTVVERLAQAAEQLVAECDGFLRREAIAASLTPDERREILRGMLLTRATDNRLKTFFISGEIKYRGAGFQGKGFRSLGQEAIYAAAIRLKRGSEWRAPDGTWQGDVVAPMIRDAGAAIAMRPDEATVRMILNAQMAKAGPPMDGRDLNIGDMAGAFCRLPRRWRSARSMRRGSVSRFTCSAPGASPCRSSARAGRRLANGTRRSTSARRGGCP
jgi:Pyruvate/2-oxoglutarate dehydrogenase complex, dehydrogenase (E1) component, eukaryotic type, alpha subunit